MTQGANGVHVAVPAMVPGQVQMSDLPAPQVSCGIYLFHNMDCQGEYLI